MTLSKNQVVEAVREVLAQAKARPAGDGATVTLGAAEMARLIDHTLLKPEATEEQVRRLCAEALQHGFATVCVNPTWVPLCAKLLAGNAVRVCTVAGFPLGANLTEVKAFEAQRCVDAGAHEIDMVLNIGALKSGQYDRVQADVAAVVNAVRPLRAVVKVIIETCYLSDEEKVAACIMSQAAGADFVKTSTGFGSAGATVEDVRLMRQAVGAATGVKAAGGIRNAEALRAMVAAGANRIGASASVQILNELGEP